MKKHVLIFPMGGENAINIHDSLKYNLHFELYGASANIDYGKELYDEMHYCIDDLFITNMDFVNKFNKIIDDFKIDYIIPTHDTIALYLMKHEKDIKAQIICSPYETARIANSKREIYESLKNKSYIPKIYNTIDDVTEYPIFLKPNIGVGGKGTFIANTKEELEDFLKNKKDIIISELLPGEEITVDCFTNYKGELLFIGPRTRERITMGISFRTKKIELTNEIKVIANDLNKSFKFRGAWFFQLKKDKIGNYKLMEFSVRQAGTMALYRMIGINFSLLSLFDAMNIDVNIMFNNYEISLERRLSNSYKINYKYDNVYIDYDDTIIIDQKVNTEAIKYIYQCNNKNIKVYLLTKHNGDIYSDLKKYHISSELFEDIFILKDNESKLDYINKDKSIFIDNYYLERYQIHDNYNIPVFDVDAISSLIDCSDL